MSELVRVLMERDNLSEDEVDELLEECRDLIYEDGMDPDEALADVCGLEPDYVFDFLEWMGEN